MNGRRILRRPRVKADLAGHYAFIARDKVEPAERFLREAQVAFERLAHMPGLGRTWESPDPRLDGVRVYPLPHGFRNYLVFYKPVPEGIEVMAVLHGARDLGAILHEFDEPEP